MEIVVFLLQDLCVFIAGAWFTYWVIDTNLSWPGHPSKYWFQAKCPFSMCTMILQYIHVHKEMYEKYPDKYFASHNKKCWKFLEELADKHVKETNREDKYEDEDE